MDDYFDQETGNVGVDEVTEERPDTGCSILVNGSYVPVEEGSPFLQTVKSVALQAGFGKFRVTLNGADVRPSTAPETIQPGQEISLRPYDEAG